MGDQRRVARQLRLHRGGLGFGVIDSGLGLIGPEDGLIGALSGLIGPGLGGRESRAQRLDVDDLGLDALRHVQSGSQGEGEYHDGLSRICVYPLRLHPALLGLQVCWGCRQSIPSSK